VDIYDGVLYEEVESLVSLGLCVIEKVPDENNRLEFVRRFGLIISQSTSYPNLRLTLLTSLFNWLNNVNNEEAYAKYINKLNSVRSDLLRAMIKYSLDTNQAFSLVSPVHFKLFDQWIADWKLQPAETYSLFLLIAQLCKSVDLVGDWHRYLLKSLSALDQEKKDVLENAKSAVHEGIVIALGSPGVMYYDTLLSMSAVKHLAEDKKYAPTYQLLRILTTETVESYTKFANENKNYVQQMKLNEEELLRKLRTLTICSLGLEKERLPYSLLKEKLQCASISAVESSVIDAVTSGCVEAKIDEANEEVIILRSMRRVFDNKAWSGLSAQLAAWKKNLTNVLTSLHQAQAQQNVNIANNAVAADAK